MTYNVSLIEELLEEQYFLEILKENKIFPFSLEDIENPENFFEKIKKDLKTKEWIIAILGIQGCGKSSFLNALVVEDNLLPTDVDETTCIPTLIRSDKDNENRINIHFKNGKVEDIEFSVEALREYVDNNFNPKNEKGVKYVEIKMKSQLLKEALVFVDLPGFGSLTRENVEVTMDFIDKTHAGIFILRTIPPITRQESFFVKFALPKLRKAWFIQNRWNDERDEEVEDAKIYNINILSNIVREIKFKDSSKLENDFFVINIYKALEGVLKSDQKMIQDSGLKAFKDNLEKSLYIWKEELINDVMHLLSKLILEALEKIRNRKMDISKDVKDLEIEVAKEKERFQNYMDDLDGKIKNLENESQRKLYSLIDKVDEDCKKAKESLRVDIYERIHGGIFDGESLTKAYNDLVGVKIEELFQNFYDLIIEYYNFINEKISEININVYEPQKKFFDTGTVNIPESLKFEKSIPPISSIIAGTFGTWGGAKIGAVIGAKIGFIGGPAGAIVGGIIGGIIGGLIGIACGMKVKSEIELGRIENAKKEVNNAIEKFYIDSKKNFINLFNEINQRIFNELKEWQRYQEKNFLNEMDVKIELSKKKKEEKELIMNKLIQQEEFLMNRIKVLKGGNLNEYQ